MLKKSQASGNFGNGGASLGTPPFFLCNSVLGGRFKMVLDLFRVAVAGAGLPLESTARLVQGPGNSELEGRLTATLPEE